MQLCPKIRRAFGGAARSRAPLAANENRLALHRLGSVTVVDEQIDLDELLERLERGIVEADGDGGLARVGGEEEVALAAGREEAGAEVRVSEAEGRGRGGKPDRVRLVQRDLCSDV
jgi:hypothetical protein